ncbi:hypothetical protein AKJ48_04100 [candidate division MSBL1 archaeon SCGC-AAA261O19]|uniref:DUF6293 domain-containing protein n=1 Tax=candidate division MSBL1 archaeon SCGC-AAA261O19 TaxID=1698277 RepID=A0A133V9W4_9EURY|nr:hypothetical protein AKJ48_04100 [candidate division MSBL1 archaeon SCGC-AAA261O19]
MINEELLEILRYVYHANQGGMKPNYNKIRREFSIAPGTVRNRIRELEEKELVDIEKIGRSKVLEVTDKGRSLLLRKV